MKYVLGLVLVGVGVAIGVGLAGGRPAAASLTRNAASPGVEVGDDVELYLDRSRSGSQVSLGGRVESISADEYCLRRVGDIPIAYQSDKAMHREVLCFVPRSAVLWIERVASEQVVPTTRPQ